MAALAETGDEQNDAREALRLADHELDQAFATRASPGRGVSSTRHWAAAGSR